jgi:O-antigen ligase
MSGNKIAQFLKNEEAVYSGICIGITGSLVFWPLLNTWLTMLLFLYWLCFAKKSAAPGKQTIPLIILFLLLFCLPVIGFFYTTNTAEAAFRLQQKTGLAVFPIVFGFSKVLNEKIYRRILVTFVWSVFAGCIVGLVYGFIHFLQSGSTIDMYGYEIVILKDTPPFVLGLYCLLSVMCLLNSLYTKILAGRSKITAIALIVFFSFFLLLLGNRTVLFTWAIVLIYFFFKINRRLLHRLIFFCGLTLTFATAIFFNPTLRTQWREMIDFSDNNTVPLDTDQSLGRAWGGKSIRMALWKCSWDIIKENWATGVGTGDVQDALQAAYEKRKFYFASRYNRYNSHNEYIQETLAYGILGLIVFAGCLLVPLVLYFNGPEYRLYSLFLLMFIIIGFSESIFELNKCIILYSFFNSIFAFTKNPNTTT